MPTEIKKIYQAQVKRKNAQAVISVEERISLLKKLKKEIEAQENTIIEALKTDFQKPAFETMLSEVIVVYKELDLFIKNLKKWSKPQKVSSSFLNFPSSDYIYHRPYGTVLVIAPWNYPFQLAINPVIAAFATGNTVILKPSELTPATSKTLVNILHKVFSKEQIAVIEGDKNVAQELLDLKWNYIFFTGSVPVGKIVHQAAAKNLTPVTLELGGKNPCVIDSSAKVKLSAKRIVWGKFLNAGQTCIAPDYILVENSIKPQLVKALKQEIIAAYGKDTEASTDYARIVNKKHFERLKEMINDDKVVFGGETNATTNFIAPTLIEEPDLESEIMQGEIFGPLLPIISYKKESEMLSIINSYPAPLAAFIFTENKKFAENLFKKFPFGGGVINDVVVHFVNDKLPFGGVGNSGIGAYHGKHSFSCFTHQQSIVHRKTWLDVAFRYAPFGNKLKWLKKLNDFI